MTWHVETSAPPPSGILAEAELIKLHQAIKGALPDHKSRIIQFLSCYWGEGAGTIASELAVLGSRWLDGRTLFVAMEAAALKKMEVERMAEASLLDVALGRATIQDAVVDMAPKAPNFSCSYLNSRGEAELLANHDKLKDLLSQLRHRFDFIMLSTPGALIDPIALQLGPIADGTVLVIEAERTRAPAAQQTLQALRAMDTRLIGIVFNKREYHIPDWAYRLI